MSGSLFGLWWYRSVVGMQSDCLPTAPHSLLFRERMKRGRRNCTNYQPGVDRPAASRNHPSKQPFSSETLWRMAGIPKLVATSLTLVRSRSDYRGHNKKPINYYATILKVSNKNSFNGLRRSLVPVLFTGAAAPFLWSSGGVGAPYGRM